MAALVIAAALLLPAEISHARESNCVSESADVSSLPPCVRAQVIEGVGSSDRVTFVFRGSGYNVLPSGYLFEVDVDGDGVFDLATKELLLDHRYERAGKYTATVRGTDQWQRVAETTISVNVAAGSADIAAEEKQLDDAITMFKILTLFLLAVAVPLFLISSVKYRRGKQNLISTKAIADQKITFGTAAASGMFIGFAAATGLARVAIGWIASQVPPRDGFDLRPIFAPFGAAALLTVIIAVALGLFIKMAANHYQSIGQTHEKPQEQEHE